MVPKGFNFEVEGVAIFLFVIKWEVLNSGYLEIKSFRPIPSLKRN